MFKRKLASLSLVALVTSLTACGSEADKLKVDTGETNTKDNNISNTADYEPEVIYEEEVEVIKVKPDEEKITLDESAAYITDEWLEEKRLEEKRILEEERKKAEAAKKKAETSAKAPTPSNGLPAFDYSGLSEGVYFINGVTVYVDANGNASTSSGVENKLYTYDEAEALGIHGVVIDGMTSPLDESRHMSSSVYIIG